MISGLEFNETKISENKNSPVFITDTKQTTINWDGKTNFTLSIVAIINNSKIENSFSFEESDYSLTTTFTKNINISSVRLIQYTFQYVSGKLSIISIKQRANPAGSWIDEYTATNFYIVPGYYFTGGGAACYSFQGNVYISGSLIIEEA